MYVCVLWRLNVGIRHQAANSRQFWASIYGCQKMNLHSLGECQVLLTTEAAYQTLEFLILYTRLGSTFNGKKKKPYNKKSFVNEYELPVVNVHECTVRYDYGSIRNNSSVSPICIQSEWEKMHAKCKLHKRPISRALGSRHQNC